MRTVLFLCTGNYFRSRFSEFWFNHQIALLGRCNAIHAVSAGLNVRADSGNIGAIAKLTPKDKMPNGIRELTATKKGFRIEFFQSVNPAEAIHPENFQVSGYTRKWSGSYATPDQDRHRAKVNSVAVAADGLSVELTIDGLREGFVYEVTAQNLERDEQQPLFPQTGHYTLHKIPQE